jgi:hypothetical protein
LAFAALRNFKRRSAAIDRKQSAVCQFGELAPEPLCQRRDEVVGIGLVIIDVGGDAHVRQG